MKIITLITYCKLRESCKSDFPTTKAMILLTVSTTLGGGVIALPIPGAGWGLYLCCNGRLAKVTRCSTGTGGERKIQKYNN